MIIDNYLLAFNGLGLLWLTAGVVAIFFLLKFKEERPYWWLLLLTGFFTFAPIVLLAANRHYPLSSNSSLLHFIVALIVCCLISLYLHTLDLLNIRISKSRAFIYFCLTGVLVLPTEIFPAGLSPSIGIARTLLFHSACVFLLILSAKNLGRVQRKTNYLQIKLAKSFLLALAFLFGFRILYGMFNPQYLLINPHEKVDFVFFLVRLLIVVFGGLALVFLISMQKYHLIRISPLNKFSSTSEYDVSAVLDERDELIDSLIKTNKTLAVGAISTSLAHELNQPLSTLNINIALLKQELLAKSVNLDADSSTIDDIQKSIDRATNIIRTVSSLSTQDNSNQEARKTSLQAVINEILHITHHTLQTHQISVNTNIDSSEVAIQKTELEQVLLNILSNAINALKKTPESQKREISIVASMNTQNKCQLSIANNGGIIPPKRAESLFQLIANSTNNGSGIGLWLSKYILDKNLAHISYKAIEPNISCFLIELPLFKIIK